MEFVRIGEGKMKLTLTEEEARRHGVDAAALAKDEAQVRRTVLALLESIKEETGFDAHGKKTLVEAFPGRRGGCELFVTLLKEKRSVHTACYRFPSIALARRAARSLAPTSVSEETSLYALSNGEVLLSLRVAEHENGRAFTPYTVLEEYGKREKNALLSAYACEYGTCLYEKNALPLLKEQSEDFSV